MKNAIEGISGRIDKTEVSVSSRTGSLKIQRGEIRKKNEEE
jgi:hypothetical protein